MSDPVADFYAREQDMFAELDDAPPAQQAAPVVAEPPAEDFGLLAVADDPPSIGGGDSGVDLNAMDFPVAAPGPILNGNASGGNSTGPSPVPVIPRIEAENIRRWKEQQKILLEKKDEAEEKKKKEWSSTAKKELEEWYSQRDATLKGAREANRKAEQDHVAAFGREQGENAQWDEIAKLCEAKAQKGGKDISRLKSLLLHLKEHNKSQ